jgi:hypothetical protein
MNSERTISELIGLIYDAAGDAARWPAFLEKLRQGLNSSASNLFVQDLHDHRFNVASQLGFDPQSQRAYNPFDCDEVNSGLVSGDTLEQEL